MNAQSDSPSQVDLDVARVLLQRIGVTPQQLLQSTEPSMPLPTFGEYIDRVSGAVSNGTRRLYRTYWNRVLAEWSERRLDEPTAIEIQQLAEAAKTPVILRRNARGGRAAAEHLVASLRCVYRYAVADGLMQQSDNPAAKVAKPRRLPSTRHALPDRRLAEINEIAATTGDDPALDSILLRLHTETACRRGGALALRVGGLDIDQCLVLLREKGDAVRWQPVSPTLMRHLIALHEERGHGDPEEQLLRYRNGRPITRRRYDYLWNRIGEHLPWVAAQGISTHWLRHTTLTWVERRFGYGVARAYAGHNDRDDVGSTTTYIRGDIEEVATALAALTGEDHPLTSPSNQERAGHQPDLTGGVFM